MSSKSCAKVAAGGEVGEEAVATMLRLQKGQTEAPACSLISAGNTSSPQEVSKALPA